jgi:hypothetical protein
MRNRLIAILALACIATTGSIARAQDQTSGAAGPAPKILLIQRESVKVGKDFVHMKNEAAYVRAATAAKTPDRYLAVTTMAGPDEAWFLVGYESFAEWEKSQAFDNSPKVMAMTGPIMEKDGDFVAESNSVVAAYNEKWSYRPDADIPHMRYFEVETIRLRPGHDKDWNSLVELFKNAAEKANLDEHDFFYEARFGAPAGTIYIFTPRKSLADIDSMTDANKKLQDALGDDGQKKWSQLIEASIASANTILAQFSPEMSYPPDDWVKADPDYWKPKPPAGTKTAAKAPAKPVSPPTGK